MEWLVWFVRIEIVVAAVAAVAIWVRARRRRRQETARQAGVQQRRREMRAAWLSLVQHLNDLPIRHCAIGFGARRTLIVTVSERRELDFVPSVWRGFLIDASVRSFDSEDVVLDPEYE